LKTFFWNLKEKKKKKSPLRRILGRDREYKILIKLVRL
jgi:hypothetical protein